MWIRGVRITRSREARIGIGDWGLGSRTGQFGRSACGCTPAFGRAVLGLLGWETVQG
jgi:hypothetical protein